MKKLRWYPDIIHCQGWISAFVPLYLKKAYQEEPSFRDSKVIFSLFNDESQSSLSENIGEKVLLKTIDKEDVEIITQPSANFQDLYKLAITYSDGIIQNSADVNPELLEYARSLGKPILDCQSSETCINDINEFYDQIWSQGKEEIKDDNEDE